MQDGDSDPVQSNISTYSLTCPFCVSGEMSRSNFELNNPSSLPSITNDSIIMDDNYNNIPTTPNNHDNNNNTPTTISKPLCPHCNRCIIQVRGNGPGKRAGHTATAVGTRFNSLLLL